MSDLTASVIIPHYRSNKSLMKCLVALSKQNIPAKKFEVIVVQNEEASLELNAPPLLNVKIIYEPKPGSYRARNKGAEASKGEYLFFTDSDCAPIESWISNGLYELKQGHKIIGGNIELRFSNPSSPRAIELYERVFYFNQKVSLKYDQYAATANLLIEKKTFYQVGKFDVSLMSGGDREWGRRAHKKGYAILFAPHINVHHPTRTSFIESLRRRVRVFSNDLYIRIRKFGLTPDGKKVLKEKLLSTPDQNHWAADWDFYESLSKKQKKKVLRIHALFSRLDCIILTLGSFNYKFLKALTYIDRLRLK
jgi:GT2 family glycosyltransferase